MNLAPFCISGVAFWGDTDLPHPLQYPPWSLNEAERHINMLRKVHACINILLASEKMYGTCLANNSYLTPCINTDHWTNRHLQTSKTPFFLALLNQWFNKRILSPWPSSFLANLIPYQSLYLSFLKTLHLGVTFERQVCEIGVYLRLEEALTKELSCVNRARIPNLSTVI